MTYTREDIELYMIGAYDGDAAALERALADDPALRALAAEEAALEGVLREAGAAAQWCPGCNDLVRGDRCDGCGVALRPGGYIVERVLVKSAHGRMYVARDADGKHVALKELAFVQSPTLEVIAAFEREAKMLRALEHPAIPRFVASFEEGSGVHTRYYLAQELVAGEALDAQLESHFYTEAEALAVARQVLEVLVYLQGLSPMVIHRDIKPANLIKRGDGSIAVVDFGAAHVQGATVGSTSIGTFGYMPVEQLAGIVDATTDVYALGATLVHLLSRREPWRLLHGATLDPLNISPATRAFLGKLVAPNPSDRFPSAAAALAALDAPPRVVALARPRSRARVVIPVAAALAVIGIGGGAFVAARRHAHRASVPEVPVPAKPIAAGNELPEGPEIAVDYHGMPLFDVLRELSTTCHFNVVMPDALAAPVTLRAKHRCKQIVDELLGTLGLGYVYRTQGAMLRVTSRADAAEVPSLVGPLPAGVTKDVDIELQSAPVTDALAMLQSAIGEIKLVPPPDLVARVSIHAARAPWQVLVEAIAAASGSRCYYSTDARTVVLDLVEHKVGRLTVDNRRPARVLVDGREVGMTPIDLPVVPGRHKVTLAVGDDRSTFTVEVTAGETTTLRKAQ